MEYITSGFYLILLIFVACQVSRIIFKRAKKISRKRAKNNQNNKSNKPHIYPINKMIAKHIFNAFSILIFLFLMIMNIWAKELLIGFSDSFEVIKYLVLIWILYYFITWSKYCETLIKETNKIWFTILIVFCNGIAFLPMWLQLGYLVWKIPNIVIFCVAIAFFLLPAYHITLSVMHTVTISPGRSLTGLTFTVGLILYTYYIVSNSHSPLAEGDWSIIKLIINALQGKSDDITHLLNKLQLLNIDHIFQIATLIWECMVIKDVMKLASKEKTSSNQGQA